MGRVAIVEGGGGQGCNNSRVGFVVAAFLLVFLVFLAQGAIRGFVDHPRHVVVAPIGGDFAILISVPLFAVLGRHFLPRLILFLILLVGSVLFILLLALVLTLVFLFLVLSDGAKLRVKLELALEGVDLGCHGHDLFVVKRFGSPLTRIFEIVKKGLRIGQENFMGQGRCHAKVAVVLLLHIDLEVVAGNDEVGVEEDVEGVLDRRPSSQNLWVVLLNSVFILSISPLTIAANTLRFCRLSCSVWVVETESMVARRIITLYMSGVYPTSSKMYSLR